MARRLRALVLLCLAPVAVWALSLVPSGPPAFGYGGGPPPPTTCPPDATTNPAGHCPPGSNGGGNGDGNGGGHGGGHGKAAADASSTDGPDSAGGRSETRVEAASVSRGATNVPGAVLKDQPAHGSTVPVTRSDVIELVILAVVGGVALALVVRALVRRRRLA